MAVTHPTTIRDEVTDLIVDKLDNGALVFRTTGTVGSPGTEVATCAFGATAFGASSSGTATANAISDDTSPTGGTVATATLETSGSAVVIHCAVAASGSDINLTEGLTIAPEDTVEVESLTYTAMP